MTMIKKGSKLYSILNHKCPKCHEGDLYPTRLLSFSELFTMKDECPHCGQKYVLEPGFYWGSMYIGYMLSSAVMLLMFGVLLFLLDMGVYESLGGAVVVLVILYGGVYRMARAIWINLYVHYDADQSGKSA